MVPYINNGKESRDSRLFHNFTGGEVALHVKIEMKGVIIIVGPSVGKDLNNPEILMVGTVMNKDPSIQQLMVVLHHSHRGEMLQQSCHQNLEPQQLIHATTDGSN